MTIRLTVEQAAWCRSHVERGDFPSIEEAVRRLIDERIAERDILEGDDLAWAKPYIEEGLAALARGDVISREDYTARNKVRLARHVLF